MGSSKHPICRDCHESEKPTIRRYSAQRERFEVQTEDRRCARVMRFPVSGTIGRFDSVAGNRGEDDIMG